MNGITPTLKRIGHFVVAGAFALSLVPGAAGATRDEPLDSGSALLMPNDVATLGYEEYGVNMGSLLSWPQLVVESDPSAHLDPAEVETHGITSLTTLVLDPVVGVAAADSNGNSFYSSVTTFTTASRAEDDFASVRDQFETDPFYEMLDEDAGVGRDSLMFESTEEWDSDTTMTSVQISFLVANVQAEVAVWFYDDAAVDLDLVRAAAEIVEEKLDSLIDSGEIDGLTAPGLSMRTVRYEAVDFVTGRSEYTVFDGEAVMSAGTPELTEALQERADEYGMLAEYTSSLEFQVGDELSMYDPLLRPRVALFEHASDAERYVQERADDLTDSPNVFEVEEVDVPSGVYADGAISVVTYETELDWGTFEMTRLFVQDGRYVYDISLAGPLGPDLEIMFAMLDDTVECGRYGCAETIDPPAELLEYFAEQREYWINELDSAGS